MKSKDEILQALNNYLADKVSFALVFGSLITDHFGDESDVDVGVYFINATDVENRGHHITELMELTGRDVDLICLNKTDLIISMQILANGQELIMNDRELFRQFKADKLSQYLDFKISRKIIEDNILKAPQHARKRRSPL